MKLLYTHAAGFVEQYRCKRSLTSQVFSYTFDRYLIKHSYQMKTPFYKSLYLLLFFWTIAACKKESDSQPVAQENAAVTADNYSRITVGMSYTQVVNILGQGKVVSTNNYSWSADDTNSIVINVIFSTSNTVVSKSQTGLYIAPTGTGTATGGGTTTTGGCPATYNGHTVYTGPRGGCYYINKNGNKTYI
jgi:hypothetical protein